MDFLKEWEEKLHVKITCSQVHCAPACSPHSDARKICRILERSCSLREKDKTSLVMHKPGMSMAT
jgi:hypothetical protein